MTLTRYIAVVFVLEYAKNSLQREGALCSDVVLSNSDTKHLNFETIFADHTKSFRLTWKSKPKPQAQ